MYVLIPDKRITMKNLIIILIFSSFFLSCRKDLGDYITLELDYTSFDAIEIRDNSQVFITYGTTQKVIANGYEELIKNIHNRVDENNIFIIDDQDNANENIGEQIIYEISLPLIKTIIIGGNGSAIASNQVQETNLELIINGNGDIDIDEFPNLKKLTVTISGNGNIDNTNSSYDFDSCQITINGNGSYFGYDLETNNANVIINGNGNAKILVSDNLNAEINGNGSVHYKGNPTITLIKEGNGNLIDEN